MKYQEEAAAFAVCPERSSTVDWERYFVQGMELLFLGIGTYFDIRDRELPITFFAAFGMLGIICNVIWKYQSLENVMIGCLIGGTFLLAGWITKEAIGYGDGIGLMVLGIFEGLKGLIPIVFGSFFLSGIYGLWNLMGLKKSGSDTMPFFPFMLLAFMGVSLL